MSWASLPEPRSGAGRPVEQPLAALLKRDEFPEHPPVSRLVFLGVHPLQPRLDRGDLPSDGKLPHPPDPGGGPTAGWVTTARARSSGAASRSAAAQSRARPAVATPPQPAIS